MEEKAVTLVGLKKKHWLEVLKACKESGQPVSVWCRENHVCESSYWYWHKKFGDEFAADAISRIPEFAELKPVGSTDNEKSSDELVIEKHDIRITVKENVSEELLMKVMRCLSNV